MAVGAFGSFRARVAHDLVPRPANAFGILRAADEARKLSIPALTILEFGVAAGAGLMNMASIARRVTQATGVNFQIAGFDTGTGMPAARDFRDHPDIYNVGDFPMEQQALRAILPRNVSLVIGDIAQTLPGFIDNLSPRAPIGYVVFDLDYYWATKVALSVLQASEPSLYLPLVCAYFDDIHHHRHNRWCGELLAIDEFNVANPMRKIDRDVFLADRRLYRRAEWIKQMFFVHVLDHPTRSRPECQSVQILPNPYLRS